jgi:hypothetical protein
MTTIHHASPAKLQAIAAHRFAVPTVREIAPVAASVREASAAARATPDQRAPLRPDRGSHTHHRRRARAPISGPRLSPVGGRSR